MLLLYEMAYAHVTADVLVTDQVASDFHDRSVYP